MIDAPFDKPLRIKANHDLPVHLANPAQAHEWLIERGFLPPGLHWQVVGSVLKFMHAGEYTDVEGMRWLLETALRHDGLLED